VTVHGGLTPESKLLNVYSPRTKGKPGAVLCDCMRFYALILLPAAVLLAGCAGYNVPSQTVAPVPLPAIKVSMTNADAFSPKDISAAPGQMISWKNADTDPHTVNFNPAEGGTFGPDSNTSFPHGVPAGATYSYVVPAGTASGTVIPYHCTFHIMMVGTITVR
jgi:plastocyanin